MTSSSKSRTDSSIDWSRTKKLNKKIKRRNMFWRLFKSIPEISVTVATIAITIMLTEYSKTGTEENKQKLIGRIKIASNYLFISTIIWTILKALWSYFTYFNYTNPFNIYDTVLLLQVLPFAFVRTDSKIEIEGEMVTDYTRIIKDIQIVIIVSSILQAILRIAFINCTVI
jgi:hypothetical protein